MVVLTFVYVFNLFTFWSSSYFLGNIAPADREVGRSFDPVLVWKSTAGDSKEGLFFFHTWCAAGAIHYWGYPFEDRILMTSVAVWGSKQHNSEGTIRGKRHSWLRGFPKTGYYGEHPLQGARCWCWWWSWWWWWSLWWSWRWCCSWYDGRFGLWVYNNEEVQLFYLYYCIFRKRMRNLYPMKKYWCQVQVSWLRLPRPSAPPTSLPELLTVTLLYKGCAENRCNCIVPLFFYGITDDVDFSHRSERRRILSRRTYQVPSSTQTTGDSLWRNSNLRMEVLKKADPCNWDHF